MAVTSRCTVTSASSSLTLARFRRAQQHACSHWPLHFNNVLPRDALRGKTPVELDKPCRCPAVVRPLPYPPEYNVAGAHRRRADRFPCANRQGIIEVNGYCVYLNLSLHHQTVGLQHESGLRWHAWLHDVLGTIEIAEDQRSALDFGQQRSRSQ
jgi:hypothetical protein